MFVGMESFRFDRCDVNQIDGIIRIDFNLASDVDADSCVDELLIASGSGELAVKLSIRSSAAPQRAVRTRNPEVPQARRHSDRRFIRHQASRLGRCSMAVTHIDAQEPLPRTWSLLASRTSTTRQRRP
jgi:hypothetical protein